MKEYSVSWTVGAGANCRGGKKRNAKWDDIEQVLKEIREQSGAVAINVMNGPDIGPQTLQVQTENGRSILTLGENTTEDYNVRSFSDPDVDANMLEIFGYLWDSRQICFNFELVIKTFKEFFETGNVSRQLLS